MAKKIGTCKLCGAASVKLAESHIIPKSLWGETLSDGTGPAILISGNKKEPIKRSPKGEYDTSLLCVPCELSFSPWDGYAYDLFVKKTVNPVVEIAGEIAAWKIPDCDFDKIRMFFLSLIWRMHTTNRPVFRAVDIGPLSTRLRCSLRKNNPAIFPELDVVIVRYDHEMAEGIIGPIKTRRKGVNGYHIMFSQYKCWVKIDKRPFPSPFDELAISNGEPLLMIGANYLESPEYRLKKAIIKKRYSGMVG